MLPALTLQGEPLPDVKLGGRSVNTTAMQWHPTQRVLAMGRADGVLALHLLTPTCPSILLRMPDSPPCPSCLPYQIRGA